MPTPTPGTARAITQLFSVPLTRGPLLNTAQPTAHQPNAAQPTAPLPTGTMGWLYELALTIGPTAAVVLLAVLLAPIVAATIVLTWHGLRGTKPGPAGQLLLDLIKIIFRRPR
jgi:hypothetical protein